MHWIFISCRGISDLRSAVQQGSKIQSLISERYLLWSSILKSVGIAHNGSEPLMTRSCPKVHTERHNNWSCKRSTNVSHCLTHSQTLTFLHSTTASLWYCSARAEALLAAWLSFYQILGPFKLMIPLYRRDQQTKSSLFLFRPLLALPLLSVPERTAAVICYYDQKKGENFPRIPCSVTSLSLFWALQKEQEASWCRHTSSVPLQCCFSLILDNRFLPKAQQTHLTVCVCMCKRRR